MALFIPRHPQPILYIHQARSMVGRPRNKTVAEMREARAIQKSQRARKAFGSLRRMAELHIVLNVLEPKSTADKVNPDKDHGAIQATEANS